MPPGCDDNNYYQCNNNLLEGKWYCGICVCLSLRIMYAAASMGYDISFVDVTNMLIILTDNVDRLVHRLRPVDLLLLSYSWHWSI